MLQLSSANHIVHLTLWVLIGFSAITWALILYKSWLLWSINYHNRRYFQQFLSANTLYAALNIEASHSALSRIAEVGYQALLNIRQNAPSRLHESSYLESILVRSMAQQINKEHQSLEQGLSLLASIGSTSPFVGLFGTVWGIMHALQSISHAKSASIDVVAGPIGEALIATAIGIAAAIPAVLAYNFFLRRIKLCQVDFESFVSSFLLLAVMSDFKTHKEDGL